MANRSVKKSEKKTGQTRIMVFGTFDIVHPGHVHFFKQARALAKNPYLIVSIARDANVKKVKGRVPVYKERTRAGHVRKMGLAYMVVLGNLKSHLQHILRQKPDVIALGYDQVGYYVESTAKYVQDVGSPIQLTRLKPHHPEKHKSSIYKLRLEKS